MCDKIKISRRHHNPQPGRWGERRNWHEICQTETQTTGDWRQLSPLLNDWLCRRSVLSIDPRLEHVIRRSNLSWTWWNVQKMGREIKVLITPNIITWSIFIIYKAGNGPWWQCGLIWCWVRVELTKCSPRGGYSSSAANKLWLNAYKYCKMCWSNHPPATGNITVLTSGIFNKFQIYILLVLEPAILMLDCL